MQTYENVPGLYLSYNVIEDDFEQHLIDEIDKHNWNTSLSRRTQHYGYEYNYGYGRSSNSFSSNLAQKASDFPPYINNFSQFIKDNMGISFNQAIINEYNRKQGIAFHTDADVFGPVVISLTLNRGCNMILKRDGYEPLTLWLPRKSLLTMSGESRTLWKHSIPKKINMIDDQGNNIKRDQDWRRISVTYRTVV